MKRIRVLSEWKALLLISCIFSTAFLVSHCSKEDVHPNNLINGKIVFSGNESLKENIFILDHSGLTKITFLDEWYCRYPAWSSDGTRIAYAKGALFGGELYWINQDGTSETLVHSERWVSPSWSPDDEWLCFAKPFGGNIYNVRSNGTGFHQIVNVNGHDPEWSPVGDKIAFVNYVNNNWEVFIVNSNGSGLTNLTNSEEAEEGPTWSPDGSLIAFSRSGEAGGSNIYYMDADGSNITQVTQFGSSEFGFSPCWSPNGTQIAFEKNRGLYVINKDGSNLRTLYDGDIGVSNPDWY